MYCLGCDSSDSILLENIVLPDVYIYSLRWPLLAKNKIFKLSCLETKDNTVYPLKFFLGNSES